MPAHVAVIDQAGLIVQANLAWDEFARANGGDLARCSVGANYFEVCQAARGDSSEGAPECLAGLRAVSRGDRQQFDLEYPCHSPQLPRWFLLRAVRVRNMPGMVVISHILITERILFEESLRSANARLAEMDHRKDEFLAMLAHELRNPLAPIRNAVQVLRMVGSPDPVLQRQQDIIDRQVSHMAHLLNDLLDISRITRDRIELKRQPLSLLSILEHAIEMTTPLMVERGHTFSVTLPPEHLCVNADFDRLAQAVGNLLANAAKYTEAGGQIWLEAASEAGNAVVHVRDSGVGISPEMLPLIFDLFVQADQSLARSQGGLGIGLTLVKKMVELHGGSVVARSLGVGQGSEFIVSLPALPA